MAEERIKQALGFVYANPSVSPICTKENLDKVLQILKDYVVVSRKELREKLVHPTNTKSVAVYDFIKELLAEKKA